MIRAAKGQKFEERSDAGKAWITTSPKRDLDVQLHHEGLEAGMNRMGRHCFFSVVCRSKCWSQTALDLPLLHS